MAYGKRKMYRRKTLRRTRRAGRSWYNRKYSAMDMGKMALSQIWKLKGLVNSELYKLDTVYANGVIGQGSVVSLHPIAIGDGDNQRTGNSVFVRSWNFKGLLGHNALGNLNQTVRLSVVMDTQQIGDTAPAYTDIYESASPYAHLQSNTVGRFKVLFSRTYTLDAAQALTRLVNINLPMRHHVRFNGSASTDIQKGGLYFCISSDETGAAGLFPYIQGESRLSYHDN